MHGNFAQGYAGGGRGRRPGSGAALAARSRPAPRCLARRRRRRGQEADVAIVVAGLYRNQDQEGRDRANFNLPPGQAELIAAVCKANPRTVVILTGGSPSSVDPWLNSAAAS